MINRNKLEHILEYAKQQRHIGQYCKVPPEDMVEIMERLLNAGNSPVIPDGYVMVPVEPNGDMLAAAQDAYGETDGDIASTIRAAMLAADPQLPGSDPATVPGKWIPVSERLPEDSGRYWCYVEEQNDLGKSHYQWNCSWNGDRWWVESEGGGIVTHWMPLPAAPQEVNRE
ncbi:Eaa1 [Klebsiella pneumoniae]|nr:Eaa1 [Klebsiella pneumoniae]